MLTNPYNKEIRLPVIGFLIFSLLLTACTGNKKENPSIRIEWNDGKAQSIRVPIEFLHGMAKDSVEKWLHVELVTAHSPILGEYSISDSGVVFSPLIAFTRGLKYEIRWKGKLVGEVDIPKDSAHALPQVVSVYPTNDTLPLNLLKVYIVFSQPMREGEALKNIIVLKNKKDTVPSVFLDLEPELWNKDQTTLTVWLDPGRIKRDLQPNIKMGNPLDKGNSYQLVINKDWQDANGVSLSNSYQKEFFVGERDSLSPAITGWTIHTPKAGSSQSLEIDLHESLDCILLTNAVHIIDNSGKIIEAVIETTAEETVLRFTPAVVWKTGDYTIEIESRLEDLAGNNLNRLFDKDLTKKNTNTEKALYKITFRIP